jgi:hypothetical protein
MRESKLMQQKFSRISVQRKFRRILVHLRTKILGFLDYIWSYNRLKSSTNSWPRPVKIWANLEQDNPLNRLKTRTMRKTACAEKLPWSQNCGPKSTTADHSFFSSSRFRFWLYEVAWGRTGSARSPKKFPGALFSSILTYLSNSLTYRCLRELF